VPRKENKKWKVKNLEIMENGQEVFKKNKKGFKEPPILEILRIKRRIKCLGKSILDNGKYLIIKKKTSQKFL